MLDDKKYSRVEPEPIEGGGMVEYGLASLGPPVRCRDRRLMESDRRRPMTRWHRQRTDVGSKTKSSSERGQ